MSTLDITVDVSARTVPVVRRGAWKATIFLACASVLAILLFIVLGRDGTATLSFASTSTDLITIPELAVPVRGFGIAATVIAIVMTIGSVSFVRSGRKVPLWYTGVFSAILVIAFLIWAAAGHTLPVVGLLAGSLALSVPLIFGAIGGVISERSGVINVAIEGQLLGGAFMSAVVASLTHSVIAGLIAAMVAGTLVSFVLAAFAITYFVDQVVVGIVLNGLILGLTNFLYETVLSPNAAAMNSPAQLPTLAIPVLSSIPVIGPVLFNQTIIVYLMYVAVAAVTLGLFFTRWGLRLRSVGEHPQAADTVGINVNGTRFWNVSLAGAIVGLGGAYFTLGSVGAFTEDVTSGAGFIALAAVIFGGWNPLRATLAALLFGFSNELQSMLSIIGSPVPSNILLMLPYVVTIVAVAAFAGHARGPAASGKAYIKS